MNSFDFLIILLVSLFFDVSFIIAKNDFFWNFFRRIRRIIKREGFEEMFFVALVFLLLNLHNLGMQTLTRAERIK